MVYLDNAATSFPKPKVVVDEMLRCISSYCANPGRGGHSMSVAAGKAVFKAREVIGRHFGIKNPMRLCFTKNATEALNIAIKGSIKPGDHVITTSMEHNSVIRPLKTMEREQGIELTIVKANNMGVVEPEKFAKSIKTNTRLIVCTLSSNVNGTILPIKEVGKLARENGVIFLVDASQGAGHIKIDIDDMYIDMLAFPGHKGLLGPQGTGGLYVKEGISLKPIMEGGTGSFSQNLFQPDSMPDILESGTLNTPGIVGLAKGVEFIDKFGVENIRLHKNLLLKRLYDGLKEIKRIKFYNTWESEGNSGIAAVNIEGIDSAEVSHILDKKYGIQTRPGLHCAPLAHKTLGTYETGLVRLSPGCFNSADEIDYAIHALCSIAYKKHK